MRLRTIAKLAAIGMLVGAAFGQYPYGYYILMRLLVCGVSVFSVLESYNYYRNNNEYKHQAMWTYGILAAVFNPFIPLHLEQEQWAIANLVAAFLIIASFGASIDSDKIGKSEGVCDITDENVIKFLSRILRPAIIEHGLDFHQCTEPIISEYGDKIKPYLQEAWIQSQEMIEEECPGLVAVIKSGKRGDDALKLWAERIERVSRSVDQQ